MGEGDATDPELILAHICATSNNGMRLVLEAGVSQDLFFGKLPRALFTASNMIFLSRKDIEPLLVLDELENGLCRKRFALKDTDLAEIRALLSDAPKKLSLIMATQYVERLKRKALRRDAEGYLEAGVKSISSATDEDIPGVVIDLSRRALALSEGTLKEKENPDPLVQYELWAQKQGYGLACGFPFYDLPAKDGGLGGLIPGTMTMATAPSSEGKTSCAIAMLANLFRLKTAAFWWLKTQEQGLPEEPKPGKGIRFDQFNQVHLQWWLKQRAKESNMPIEKVMQAQRDFKCLYFSTEMVAGALAARIVQNLTASSFAEIRAKGYTATKNRVIMDWFKTMRDNLFIFDKVKVAAEMVSAVALYRPSWPEELINVVVIIDHMHQLVGVHKAYDEGSMKGNLNIFYKQAYEMLFALAKTFHVHVLALDQMSTQLQTEFRTTNNVASLNVKEGGDAYNIVDNAFVFGKSNEKRDASVLWIKKLRNSETSLVYEMPNYLQAFVATSHLAQIPRDEYQALAKLGE